MKNCYLLVVLFIMGYNINAQVGINTNNPKSTLHVQKRTELTFPDGIIPPRISGDSLRLKEAAYTAAQNGAIVYVTSPATTTGPKTNGVTSDGLFIYDAVTNNSSGNPGLWFKLPTTASSGTTGDGAFSAKFTSTLSLLGLGVGGGILNLNIGGSSGGTTTIQVPSTSMSNGVYTVPSTGLYQINFSYKEGTGASVSLLTNSGIIINRTPVGSSTATTLDSKGFGGVSVLAVLTVSITQTTINHVYSLTAGDKIQFGINRQGIATLDLANASEADISIYKIR
ncbi:MULTISPECIES: hypothetical protein [Chryseobacterium]|uniref:hypothetical protein n=1 Tax=Chryseobacterium TaxID=59732 RepID=UPI0011AF2264|nr:MULTISPECIES: hypothetical protein [Chryseobacterium]VXB01470.1 conserved exported hypothetical protein [Chryseobacterium sp. 8AT]